MNATIFEPQLTVEQLEAIADEIATFAARIDVAKHALLTAAQLERFVRSFRDAVGQTSVSSGDQPRAVGDRFMRRFLRRSMPTTNPNSRSLGLPPRDLE